MGGVLITGQKTDRSIMEKVGLAFLLLTLLLKGKIIVLVVLSKSSIILSSSIVGITGQTTFGISEVKPNCSGANLCLKYDANKQSNTSVYWYDKSSGECVLLGKRCLQPNINSTFKTKGKCMEACIGQSVMSSISMIILVKLLK